MEKYYYILIGLLLPSSVFGQTNLHSAITRANTDSSVIHLYSRQSITTNDTLNAVAQLDISIGGRINIEAGDTLWINGSFKAGSFQVFEGVGGVVFGSGAADYIDPFWFPSSVTAAQILAIATNANTMLLIPANYPSDSTIARSSGDAPVVDLRNNRLSVYESIYTDSLVADSQIVSFSATLGNLALSDRRRTRGIQVLHGMNSLNSDVEDIHGGLFVGHLSGQESGSSPAQIFGLESQAETARTSGIYPDEMVGVNGIALYQSDSTAAEHLVGVNGIVQVDDVSGTMAGVVDTAVAIRADKNEELSGTLQVIKHSYGLYVRVQDVGTEANVGIYTASPIGLKTLLPKHNFSEYSPAPVWAMTDTDINTVISSAAQATDTSAVIIDAATATPNIKIVNAAGGAISWIGQQATSYASSTNQMWVNSSADTLFIRLGGNAFFLKLTDLGAAH